MKTKIHTIISLIALSLFLMDVLEFPDYEKWLGFNLPTLTILVLILVIPNIILLRKNGYSKKSSLFLLLGILFLIFYYTFFGYGLKLINGIFANEVPGLTDKQKNEIICNIKTDTLTLRELHFASKLLALNEYHTTGNILTHFDLSGQTVTFSPTTEDIEMRESTLQSMGRGQEMLPELNSGFWSHLVIFSLLIFGAIIWPLKRD